MSHVSLVTENHRPDSTAERVRGEGEITDLLTALDDPDCRAVLEATGDEALSAQEVVDRCGIPSSTAYRKIDRLVELGLLEEGLRIRRSGKHASEYRRNVDQVSLSIGDGGSELHLIREQDRIQAVD